MDTAKLKIKIGTHDFEAEGPTELVRSMFEKFAELINSDNIAHLPDITHNNLVQHQSPAEPSTSRSRAENEQATIDATQMGKEGHNKFLLAPPKSLEVIFSHNAKGRFVALRMWKKERHASDALLLIMLGFKLLRGEEEVKVTQLTSALADSGIVKKRVDDVSRAHVRDGLIIKYGKTGPGGLYRLTSKGQTVAEEILRGLEAEIA